MRPRVLIISERRNDGELLKMLLPSGTPVRIVRSCLDTEGRDTDIVVIGGAFPLAELIEVRAHPNLFDKPVVLFAPGRALPAVDWRSMNTIPLGGNAPPSALIEGLLRVVSPDEQNGNGRTTSPNCT